MVVCCAVVARAWEKHGVLWQVGKWAAVDDVLQVGCCCCMLGRRARLTCKLVGVAELV